MKTVVSHEQVYQRVMMESPQCEADLCALPKFNASLEEGLFSSVPPLLRASLEQGLHCPQTREPVMGLFERYREQGGLLPVFENLYSGYTVDANRAKELANLLEEIEAATAKL